MNCTLKSKYSTFYHCPTNIIIYLVELYRFGEAYKEIMTTSLILSNFYLKKGVKIHDLFQFNLYLN